MHEIVWKKTIFKKRFEFHFVFLKKKIFIYFVILNNFDVIVDSVRLIEYRVYLSAALVDESLDPAELDALEHLSKI